MDQIKLTKKEAAFLAVMLFAEKDNLTNTGKDLLDRLISFSSSYFASMIADILTAKEK